MPDVRVLRPRWSERALPVLTTVAALAFVTGCSGSQRSAVEDFRSPELATVPVVDDSIQLPFDRYEMSVADRVRAQSGQAVLIRRCMAERGFPNAVVYGDYLLDSRKIRLKDVTVNTASYASWGGPFGTMSLDHARRWGYRPEPGGDFSPGPGWTLRSLDAFALGSDPSQPSDPLISANFSGSEGMPEGLVPEGKEIVGCDDEVKEALDAPIVDTSDVAKDMIHLSRAHPVVVAAVDRWVECMNSRGHSYANVWDPSTEFQQADLSEQQIKVATDDVECTQQSGWANAFYAALKDYQEQAVNRDPAFFEGALAAQQARLAAVEAAR